MKDIDMQNEHPFTQFEEMYQFRQDLSYITTGICKYTGGGTKLSVFVPEDVHGMLTYPKYPPLSLAAALVAEGYLTQRHMLDHRYPALIELVRELIKHRKTTQEMANQEPVTKHRPITEKIMAVKANRNTRREWIAELITLERYRQQFTYMTSLQASLVHGGPKPTKPQGIITKGTKQRMYNDDPRVPILTHLNKTLQNAYTVKTMDHIASGGGKYWNITIPTYIKKHIDATGLKPSLFLTLATDDWRMIRWPRFPITPFYHILSNMILQRASTKRNTPMEKLRAVLFKDHHHALRQAATTHHSSYDDIKARPVVTINRKKQRTRHKQILSDYEGLSIGELKDIDPDQAGEIINDRWPDYTQDEKKEYDLERYKREQEGLGPGDRPEEEGLGKENAEQKRESNEGLTAGDRCEEEEDEDHDPNYNPN